MRCWWTEWSYSKKDPGKGFWWRCHRVTDNENFCPEHEVEIIRREKIRKDLERYRSKR